MRIYPREIGHEIEPPKVHQKLCWFLWSPPAAFHWCKPPFSLTAEVSSPLNFLPIQNLGPSGARFLCRPPSPSDEWAPCFSSLVYLFLAGVLVCLKLLYPTREQKTFPSLLLKDIFIVEIWCWQWFSSGLWRYYSLFPGFRDFGREVGSKSAALQR